MHNISVGFNLLIIVSFKSVILSDMITKSYSVREVSVYLEYRINESPGVARRIYNFWYRGDKHTAKIDSVNSVLTGG